MPPLLRALRHVPLISVTALLVGWLLSGWGALSAQHFVDTLAQEDFNRLSSRVRNDLQRRFDVPLYGLRGAAGLYRASETVTRQEFRAFAQEVNVSHQFDGLLGFGYIVRIPRAELARLEADERRDQAPDFTVHPPSNHPDRYVIKIIEPLEKNRPALGFDIGSEPVRRQAAEQAVDTARPTLTHRIKLVQDSKQQAGLLLLQPLYHRDPTKLSVEQRRAALQGLVYSPIALGDIFQGWPQTAEEQLDITLDEAPRAGAAAVPLFEFRGPAKAGAEPARFAQTLSLRIGEQDWLLHVRSNAAFEKHVDHNGPALIAVGGAVLSLLLAIMLWLITSRRARAEVLAARMTVDLDRLAQVVRLTSTAVAITDRQGRITWINEGFTRVYGHTSEEANGHLFDELVGTDRSPAAARQALVDSLRDGTTFRADLINQAKDGRELRVEFERHPLHSRSGSLDGFIDLSRDVTALKEALMRMEAALRDTATLHRTLDEHAIVSITDRGGFIIDVNPAFCRISGYSREELIGHKHSLVNSGMQALAFWQSMWDAISAGKAWRGEICNRAKDGSLYWVDSIIAPFFGADGKIEKYISIRNDITSRKRAEQALRSNRAMLDRIGHVAGVGGWQFEVATNQVTWSDQTCRIYDMPPGYQPPPDNPLWYFDAGVRKQFNRLVDEALEHGRPWDVELPARTATGRDIWVRSIGEAEFEGHQAVRLVGATQDITEQREARQRLTQTTALLTNVLNAASEVSIIATDAQLNITVFNTGAERLLGYRSDEMVGEATPAAFHDAGEIAQRARAMSEALRRSIDDLEVFTDPAGHGQATDWTYIRKDGRRVSVSLVVTAQRDTAGQIIGYLGIAYDNTLRKEYESSLQQAKQQAEQANVAKSQFLANMSHEIRTPLNAILGMLRLLHRTPLNRRQLDYARKTESAAQSLLALLNDILDFSKVEAGKLTLDPHPFSVEQLMRDLAVILSVSADTKPVEVLFDLDPNVPPHLVADALRLKQVLINLGGNAVKFTAQGEVVVGMALLARDEHRARLRFWVRDTGIGIAPTALEHIFKGFSQAEASTTRRFGGTGLGLAISQRLVELMGGTLGVDSTLGRGSEFAFELSLPVAPPPAASPTTAPAEPTPALHVLIVDDNPTARNVLSAQVSALGWRGETVSSGEQAIERIQASLTAPADSGARFDAVFVDWRMPGLNGWDTSSRIRQCTPEHAMPLIIMVTAHDREDLAQRCADNPTVLDTSLVKPVTPSMLLDAVRDARAAQPAETSITRPAPLPNDNVAPPSTPQRLTGLRILLVEDNANNRQVAHELLSDEGALVTEAFDGQAGVHAVLQATPPFDVVLMDMHMPVMDGLTATARIRDVLGPLAPPIIAMTANVNEADRATSLSHGLVDHIGKPFDLDHLVATLRRHTGRTRGAALRAPAAPVAATLSQHAQALGVDLPAAVARLGDRQDVYRRMLTSFAKDLATADQDLCTSWRHGDISVLQSWLHTLKGLAGTLGFTRLHAALAEAENQLPQITDTSADRLPAGLQAVQSSVSDAQGSLTALCAALDAQPSFALPPPAAAAAPGELVSGLRELVQRLERSDMGALALHERVVAAHGAALGAEGVALELAMSNLDFAAAATQCRTLITKLERT